MRALTSPSTRITHSPRTRLGGLEGRRIRIGDDLGQAVMVAQVDEQQAAMVAHAVHPARQADGLADIGFAEFGAVMAAVAVHRRSRSGWQGCWRRGARLEIGAKSACRVRFVKANGPRGPMRPCFAAGIRRRHGPIEGCLPPEPPARCPPSARSIPLLVAAGILLGGNGLQGTLIALRGAEEGFSPAIIGFMGTTYFGGFLLGCVFITPDHEGGRPCAVVRRARRDRRRSPRCCWCWSSSRWSGRRSAS